MGSVGPIYQDRVGMQAKNTTWFLLAVPLLVSLATFTSKVKKKLIVRCLVYGSQVGWVSLKLLKVSFTLQRVSVRRGTRR